MQCLGRCFSQLTRLSVCDGGRGRGESRGACVRQKCLHVVEARRGKLPFSSTWCEHWPCGGCLSAWVCVCLYVCEALLFTNFDKFLFRIISCAQAVHTRTNTHTHTQAHHCTARHMANSLSPRLPPTMQTFTAGVNILCCCCSLCCCAHAMSPCVDKKEKKARNENTKNRKKTAFFVHYLSAQ